MQNNEIKKPKLLWTIVALLTLLLLSMVSYKLKDRFKPIISATAPLNKSCDLRKDACTSKLPGGGTVRFSITPNDIPILRPLTFDVTVDGIAVSNVTVDLIGIGMDMGYNHSKLESSGNNQFVGKTTIPVCTQSKMDWEARVMLQTDRGLIMAPFQFYTLK